MRSRVPLFALLFAVGLFSLPLAAHAGIPFFGPIIPDAINKCAAGWGMLITVINNIISLLITLAIVFVAPLMIAWSGFLFVVNPVNSSGISQAKSILTNTVVGIVIALCGWLIVDAVMSVLYVGNLGAWSQIINWNGDACLIQEGSLYKLTPASPGVTGSTANGILTTGGTLSPGTGACDASVVQQAATTGGYNLTISQANVLACIAKPESTCGANTNVAHQKDGTPTTATGAFQITFGAGTDNCHQLNLQVCTDAAATAVGWNGGNLNCSSVFTCSLSNPSACQPKSGKVANAAACTAAALNLNCNASAAACMVANRNGGFGDWTADPRSAIQTQCIDKYAN